MHIPFTQPYWDKRELRAVENALQTTLGTGDGPWSKKVVEQMQKLLNVRYVYPVTSCTHGLEMALSALDVRAGDEVIVPSFTMSSTANAVLINGGKPVFCDIEEDSYAMDPQDMEWCITPRTKGIIVVHYAGMPARIDEILRIAKRHHLFVVEDAAHCVGASYKKKALGTFGDVGVYSFHGTKNLCSGEGGVVVSHREDVVDAMDIYRANGTNRRQFLRGVVDKYTWVGKGTSFFLSDLLAAIMSVQLAKIDTITQKRTAIARMYTKLFQKYQHRIFLPQVPDHTIPNWHIYALRFHKEADATVFYTEMKKKGITVTTHYVPLHSSPMGRKLAGKSYRKLPVTERVASTLIRMPLYPGMTKKQLSYVCSSAQAILERLVS